MPERVSEENRAAVEQFFTSLEKLDIQSFLKVWSDNGRQIMPLAPNGFPAELNGKEAIFNQYKGLPDNFTAMSFPRKISATNDPNKVIVQYQGIIPLKAGGEYNNNYVGIFEIKNGKIEKFTEYFDPFILEKRFRQKIAGQF
jgi:ketosteroid isomerase-like protein